MAIGFRGRILSSARFGIPNGIPSFLVLIFGIPKQGRHRQFVGDGGAPWREKRENRSETLIGNGRYWRSNSASDGLKVSQCFWVLACNP